MLEKLKEKAKSLSSQKRKNLLFALGIAISCIFVLTIIQAIHIRDTGFKEVERNVTCEQYGYETLIKINDTFSWCTGNKYVWGGIGPDPTKKQNEVNYLNARN